MSVHYPLRALLVFLCVLCSNMALCSDQKVVLTFGYEDKENYPAFVGTGTAIPEHPGTYVEILREVTAKLDIELRLARIPWNQALKRFESGDIDALNGSFKTSREAFAEYPRNEDRTIDSTKHITRDAYVLYVPQESPMRWNGVNKFTHEGTRRPVVGTPYNYSIGVTLKELGVSVVENPGGFEPLVRTLLADRVQGIVVHERPMQYFLLDRPDLASQIEKTFPAVQAKYYYIMLSKAFVAQHPELSEAFWQTLKEVRSQRLDDLMTKYRELRNVEAAKGDEN